MARDRGRSRLIRWGGMLRLPIGRHYTQDSTDELARTGVERIKAGKGAQSGAALVLPQSADETEAKIADYIKDHFDRNMDVWVIHIADFGRIKDVMRLLQTSSDRYMRMPFNTLYAFRGAETTPKILRPTHYTATTLSEQSLLLDSTCSIIHLDRMGKAHEDSFADWLTEQECREFAQRDLALR